jgi:hypothetical protein
MIHFNPIKPSTKPKYLMSFTAGAALIPETVLIAGELRKQQYDWKKVIDKVKNENIISSVKQSSGIRVLREVRKRIELLTKEEITLLLEGSLIEQKCMLWLAICKRYQFIQDFAREVIHEKIQLLEQKLTEDDYHKFFHKKASWYEELDTLTELTKIKVRTVLFRMLRELGFLSGNGLINTLLLPDTVKQVLESENTDLKNIYPG